MAKTTAVESSILQACPCAGGHLDKFIQAAMLSVLAGEPLHGYLIVQRLRKMPMFREHAPDLTGVYRLLKAMEGRDLVVCEWAMPERGPAKKQFRITPRGLECLGKWIATIQDYSSQLSDLLDVLKASPGRRRACRCACRSKSAARPAARATRAAASSRFRRIAAE